MGVMGVPGVLETQKTGAVTRDVMGVAGALETRRAVLICSLLLFVAVLPP